MNKKHLLQTMFAMCMVVLFTTGCTNDVLTSPNDDGTGNEETTIVFNLGVPGSDEVHYTRAEAPTIVDDATEWTIKTLKVYHFYTTTTNEPKDENYILAKAYDVPVEKEITSNTTPAASGTCADYGDGNYSLRLSLRSNIGGDTYRHRFVIVANDVCSDFDQKVQDAIEKQNVSSIKLDALKLCIADKQLNNDTNSADLFMGSSNGLCMTGETGDLTLKVGHNAATAEEKTYTIELVRIMARLDVQSFVAASEVFQLKSVSMKYNGKSIAPKGYLFEAEKTLANDIWRDKNRETLEITHRGNYNTIGFLDYKDYASPDNAWVDVFSKKFTTTDGKEITREGTWYKKVLFINHFC